MNGKLVVLDPQTVFGKSFDKGTFLERLRNPDSRASFYDGFLHLDKDGQVLSSALYGAVKYEVKPGEASIGKKICPEDLRRGRIMHCCSCRALNRTSPRKGGVYFDRERGDYIVRPGQKIELDLSQERAETLLKVGRAFARQESLEHWILESRKIVQELVAYERQLQQEKQLQRPSV